MHAYILLLIFFLSSSVIVFLFNIFVFQTCLCQYLFLFFLLVTPDEAFHDPLRYQKFPLPGGKPLNIRRGPGRPRKERPLGITRGGSNRRSFGRGGARGKGFVLINIIITNNYDFICILIIWF